MVRSEVFFGGKRYTTIWESPTWSKWSSLVGSGESVEDEIIWRNFLIQSDLFPSHEGNLTLSHWKDLQNFRPGTLPLMLIKDFYQELFLTEVEKESIQRQCYTLWGSGTLVNNPHPLLAQVVRAMTLKEQLGITMSYSDLSVKFMRVFEIVAETIPRIMDMQRQKADQERSHSQRINKI